MQPRGQLFSKRGKEKMEKITKEKMEKITKEKMEKMTQEKMEKMTQEKMEEMTQEEMFFKHLFTSFSEVDLFVREAIESHLSRRWEEWTSTENADEVDFYEIAEQIFHLLKMR